ncbi:hypothetical protein AAE478_010190 [Parahypoxylon ruwenzoriense]
MRSLTPSSFIITSAALLPFALATPAPTSTPAGSLVLEPLLDVLQGIGNAPPPTFLWTPAPSPQCAAINQGALQCCQGSLAGDLPVIQFLAALYGYQLNPNDVNGILCDGNLDGCPGVKLCCQVTALNPLLSLYCQDYR